MKILCCISIAHIGQLRGSMVVITDCDAIDCSFSLIIATS